MSEQANSQLAQNLFAYLNAHDAGKIGELYAENIRTEAPGAPELVGKEAGLAYVQVFFTAFPDVSYQVVRIIAQGDHVAIHWIGRGTHAGPLMTLSGNTIPPTGRKAAVPGCNIIQIKEGKVVGNWLFWDMALLLAQLGLLPAM